MTARLQIRREILDIDRVTHDDHAGMTDHVLEFADIARPTVPAKHNLCSASGPSNDFVELARELGDKVVH